MKAKNVFVCQECGAQSQKWLGRCADCGAWNSLVEERVAEPATAPVGNRYGGLAPGGGNAQLYADVQVGTAQRITTGIGEPIACWAAASCPARWCCSAASPASASRRCVSGGGQHRALDRSGALQLWRGVRHQIKSRGELSWRRPRAALSARGDVPRAHPRGLTRLKPALVVVDSIQTIFSMKMQSAPGSIGQVREAATQLLFAAKTLNVPTFVVGHVTKEGNLAGPKALEHIVDTVLYFEGERHHSHRVVRAVKNRFGAISELGVFEMTGEGLRAVANPSALFLAERPVTRGPPALLGGGVTSCSSGAGAVSASTFGNGV